ncbi:MAG: aminotransferase class V-fold PLP-dependent enzyme [Thermomicrobiales bacterium]
MESFYARYGIKTVINAAGPMTKLSGHVLAPEVRDAMASAGAACARIEDLQEAAGDLIARVTGAEAGYVTAGAAAGLALEAAAAIAGLDVAAMDQLPDTTGLRNEIIIQRGHITAYSHALRVSGARLVEVGYVGYPGQGRTWPWQVEAAFTERTAAIAYSVGSAAGMVDLPGVVEIAHRHGVPVIVDAAATLPPAGNLRRFVEERADLVCFSGGKAIGGPQASGIIAGRGDLIASIALQHQDMDVEPETWTWRSRYLAENVLPGPPHHGLGRPMKVGKEEIAGLMTALDLYVARDHPAEWQGWHQMLVTLQEQLSGIPGVAVDIVVNQDVPESVPGPSRVGLDEGADGEVGHRCYQ